MLSPRPGNANEDDARNAGGTSRPISRALDTAARIVYTRNCITSTSGTNAAAIVSGDGVRVVFIIFRLASYSVVIIIVVASGY